MVKRCPNLSRIKEGCSVVPLPNGILQICSFIYLFLCVFARVCSFFFPCFNPSEELALSENDQKKTDNTHHSLIWICCFCFCQNPKSSKGLRVPRWFIQTWYKENWHPTHHKDPYRKKNTSNNWDVKSKSCYIPSLSPGMLLMGPKYGWLITRIL